MNELRDWLKAGDPVATDPGPSDAEVQQMRRAIVAAAESLDSPFADWARGSWAAATVVVALTIAVSMSRWLTPREDVRHVNRDVTLTPTPPEIGARRQMQLITPGGTRVIWIFNAEFNP